MKRKISLLIAVAAPLAIALIAAGCGSSANGSAYSSSPYGSTVNASAPKAIAGWEVLSRAGRKVETDD
jgi:hypothetical protein